MPLCFNVLRLTAFFVIRCLVSQFCLSTRWWPYLLYILMSESQSTDIERFSDRVKLRTTLKRDPLEQILRLTSNNFPLELVQGLQAEQLIRFFFIRNLYTEFKDCSLHIELPGMKGATHNKRKVRWNPESGLMRIEYLDFNFFAYFCILGF